MQQGARNKGACSRRAAGVQQGYLEALLQVEEQREERGEVGPEVDIDDRALVFDDEVTPAHGNGAHAGLGFVLRLELKSVGERVTFA